MNNLLFDKMHKINVFLFYKFLKGRIYLLGGFEAETKEYYVI